MNKITCAQDLEDYAFRVLPKMAFDYYACGAGSEETLKENRKQYLRYRIRPRVLCNVAVRDLSTTVLGEKILFPIGISPTAMQKMAHPEGECATARAAQAVGTIFIQSTLSTCNIEDIAAAAPSATKWFQLYILKDRDFTKKLIKRVQISGFKAIVLTVDGAVSAKKRALHRNEFSLPSNLTLANLVDYRHNIEPGGKVLASNTLQGNIEWHDVKWLQSVTDLPIILKGILTAEDAIIAANMKLAGILVSNQGGRQLDTAISPMDALPEIVNAVGDKVEIYLDGGIREGIDVFKALALGAKMVFVGRPAIWGLAYNGEDGVKQMLNILKSEFDEALALAGCSSVDKITRTMVIHERYLYKQSTI